MSFITPIPFKAFDKHGLVFYLGGLSKSLSPSLRIEWIVGPGPGPVVEHSLNRKEE